MLTIHHLGMSQSERIVWLLEELELPYELLRYQREPATKLAPAEYKALHSFGTAPVLDDGDLRLAESGAIIEHVIHTHGQGRLAVAPGTSGYADYLFWWHFANASMMPAAMIDGLVRRLGAATIHSSARCARGTVLPMKWSRSGWGKRAISPATDSPPQIS